MDIPNTIKAVPADTAIYLMRAAGDMQINCVVDLPGRVDEDRLGRAVRLLMDAEPVVGCRFIVNWWSPAPALARRCATWLPKSRTYIILNHVNILCRASWSNAVLISIAMRSP